MSIWQELGIEPTDDRDAIRRAYARRVKSVHPEDDPEAFQRLRQSYEAALAGCWTGEEEALFPEDPPARNTEPATDGDTADDESETFPHDPVAATAASLVERVVAALKHADEDAAIAAFRSVLDDPELVRIGVREAFEEHLLWALQEVAPFPEKLVRKAFSAFGWDDAHQTAERVDAQIDWLHESLLGRERLRELCAEARPWLLWVIFDRRRLAPSLLTGGFRPKLFAVAAMSSDCFFGVYNLMRELGSYFPGVLHRDLDSEVVGWWAEKIEAYEDGKVHRWRSETLFGLDLIALIILWSAYSAPEIQSDASVFPFLIGAVGYATWRFFAMFSRVVVSILFATDQPAGARFGLAISTIIIITMVLPPYLRSGFATDKTIVTGVSFAVVYLAVRVVPGLWDSRHAISIDSAIAYLREVAGDAITTLISVPGLVAAVAIATLGVADEPVAGHWWQKVMIALLALVGLQVLGWLLRTIAPHYRKLYAGSGRTFDERLGQIWLAATLVVLVAGFFWRSPFVAVASGMTLFSFPAFLREGYFIRFAALACALLTALATLMLFGAVPSMELAPLFLLCQVGLFFILWPWHRFAARRAA